MVHIRRGSFRNYQVRRNTNTPITMSSDRGMSKDGSKLSTKKEKETSHSERLPLPDWGDYNGITPTTFTVRTGSSSPEDMIFQPSSCTHGDNPFGLDSGTAVVLKRLSRWLGGKGHSAMTETMWKYVNYCRAQDHLEYLDDVHGIVDPNPHHRAMILMDEYTTHGTDFERQMPEPESQG